MSLWPRFWTQNFSNMNSLFHEAGLWEIPIPHSGYNSLFFYKREATVSVHIARSKQGLKEINLMCPQLEDRGSTYEGFEVRKDRWWAFPLQLSHLLSLQHWALCFPVTLTVGVSTLFYQACICNSNCENTLWNKFLDVLWTNLIGTFSEH